MSLPSWPPGQAPMMRVMMDGVITEIPAAKPRLTMVLDAYAIKNNQPWCCSHAGFCARGATMENAYRALDKAMDDLFPKQRPYKVYTPSRR